MSFRFSAAAATVAALLMGCGAAETGDAARSASEPLTTVDTVHTNAGAVIVQKGGHLKRFCSGVLISPTVFLTAGHCTDAAAQYQAAGYPLFVSLDQTITDASPVVAATPHTAPDFNPAYYNINSDSHDVGVMTLASAITGVAPAAPPSATLLESLKLKPGAPITAVGYGLDQSGVSGSNVTYAADTTRNSGTLGFLALSAYITANQVQADGVCFGDSGGPDFVRVNGQDQLVGINVVVNGYDCNEIAWLYRLDSASTRAFLGQYVALP